MQRTDITYQVSLTLGECITDYDIDGIVDDLIAAHDGNLDSIDDFDSQTYWSIVEAHDTTAQADNNQLVAWLSTLADTLDHCEGPEIAVFDHRTDGDLVVLMPSVSLPLSLDADHGDMMRAATAALEAAGWEPAGEWDGVDTGYTIPVRRIPAED